MLMKYMYEQCKQSVETIYKSDPDSLSPRTSAISRAHLEETMD